MTDQVGPPVNGFEDERDPAAPFARARAMVLGFVGRKSKRQPQRRQQYDPDIKDTPRCG